MDNKNIYNHVLTEKDFYPPSDNRTWKSNVRDIYGGDNFADFCEYYFELLDREEYFEGQQTLTNKVIDEMYE